MPVEFPEVLLQLLLNRIIPIPTNPDVVSTRRRFVNWRSLSVSMEPPQNVEVFQTETIRCWLVSGGLLYSTFVTFLRLTWGKGVIVMMVLLKVLCRFQTQ